MTITVKHTHEQIEAIIAAAYKCPASAVSVDIDTTAQQVTATVNNVGSKAIGRVETAISKVEA